jgi:NADH-quinone oxidoreductase subunit M
MFRRVIFGPLNNPENQKLQDLNGRELTILAPILFLIVLMGVYPQPILNRLEPAVELSLKKILAVPALPAAADSKASGEQNQDGR